MCDGGGTLDVNIIVVEYVAFFCDVVDVLYDIGDPWIWVFLGALVLGGHQVCNCCGDGSCGGIFGWMGLQFL